MFKKQKELFVLFAFILMTANAIAGEGGRVTLTPIINGQPARIEYLSSINQNQQVPLAIYFHGAGENQNSDFTNVESGSIINALIAQGYIVATTATSGDGWGNQAEQTTYLNLYNHIKDKFQLSKIIFIAQSMGGLSSLNLISAKVIPVSAWYGIVAVTNLANMYVTQPRFAGEIQSAYKFTSPSQYAVATAGYDPNLKSALNFAYCRYRATASYSDTIVSRANNADLFFAKIVTLVPQAAIVTVTGDHGDKSGFIPQDVVNFFAIR